MKHGIKNPSASVLARLKNEAVRTHEPFNPLLSRYIGFRFLYRLALSPHRDQFLLKGASMFLFWTGSLHRTTRDLDLLSLAGAEREELDRIFREACEIDCPQDGVIFGPETVESEPIRIDQPYGGARMRLVGKLGSARVPLQIDVGAGDAVTPGPMQILLPAFVADVPETHMLGYPVEAAIAEKFHAMVELGLNTSRMKDFYDVAHLALTIPPEPETLREAVQATFRRRGTSLPSDLPIALTDEFLASPAINARWTAFAKRNALKHPFSSLSCVQQEVRNLIGPLLAGSGQ